MAIAAWCCVLALTLVACPSRDAEQGRGSSSPAGFVPSVACRRIVSSKDTLVASYPTTVGFVRRWKTGPGLLLAENAWPGYADDAPAAWCWMNTSADETVVSAVGPDGTAVRFVTASPAVSPPPSGSPDAGAPGLAG